MTCKLCIWKVSQEESVLVVTDDDGGGNDGEFLPGTITQLKKKMMNRLRTIKLNLM